MFQGLVSWNDGTPLIYQNWYQPQPNSNYLNRMHATYFESFFPVPPAFPYVVHKQPTGVSYIQPIFHLSRNSCVANFAGGHLSLGNWKWMTINCSQDYDNVTIICERYKSNTSEKKPVFRIDDHMDVSAISVSKQNQTIVIPTFFCKLGWFYLRNKCYNMRMKSSNLMENSIDNCVIIGNRNRDYNTTIGDVIDEIDELHSFYYIWDEIIRYLTFIDLMICESPPLFLNSSTVGVYQCVDTNFILQHYVCDGYNDCNDASDEEHCKHVCNSEDTFNCFTNCSLPECQCDLMYFQCARRGCVSLSRICDGFVDCDDASDETFCTEVLRDVTMDKAQTTFFTCKSGLQIESSMLNDTIPDCPEYGDDESLSPDYDALNIRNNISLMIQCKPNHPARFPLHMLCVLTWEKSGVMSTCRNGAHLANCRNHSCPDLFKCQHTYCIPVYMLCDGMKDCPDGEDEHDCQHIIHNNLLKCRGSQNRYIHLNRIKDGVVDCPIHNDDEVISDIIPCPGECECFGYAVFCSGEVKDFNRLSFAKALFIRGLTNLAHVDFISFTKLLLLDISDSEIKQLPPYVFHSPTSVTNLTLANVSLSEVPIKMLLNLTNLLKLVLSQNNISLIPFNSFGGLSSLQYLALDNINLHEIKICGFTGLYSLLLLNLSHNRLNIISQGSMCGVDNLRVLDISNNDIHSVDNDVFDGISLQQLTSSINGLCCYVTPSVQCKPTFVDDFSSCDNILSNIGIKIIVWILAIVSMIENTAVLVAFQFLKSKKVSIKRYIHKILNKQLIISDGTMGVYFLALAVYDIIYTGNYLVILDYWKKSWHCKGLAFVSLLSFEMSLCMSLVLSVERIYAVCFPFKQMLTNASKARILSVICWLISALLALSPVAMLYIKGKRFNDNLCIMLLSLDELPMMVNLLLFTINTLVPILNVILNTVIIKTLHKVQKRQQDMTQKDMYGDRGITSRIILLVFVNSSCWIFLITLTLFKEFGMIDDSNLFANLIIVCLPISSLINPILNCFTSQEFKTIFKKM